MMFPLGQCLFEGGYFPCPRFPEMFLTSFYGPTWKVPHASRKQKGTDLFFFTQPLKLLAHLAGSGSPVAPSFRRLEGSWHAHGGGNVSHSTHLRRRGRRLKNTPALECCGPDHARCEWSGTIPEWSWPSASAPCTHTYMATHTYMPQYTHARARTRTCVAQERLHYGQYVNVRVFSSNH